MRKRRWKAGSERRRRQRLQTKEARGRVDGSGARRRRISQSMSSLSIGGAARELGRPRRLSVSVIALSQLVRDVKAVKPSGASRSGWFFPEGKARDYKAPPPQVAPPESVPTTYVLL